MKYKVKVYGHSDADLTAEKKLEEVIDSLGEMHLQYIVLHPRKPIDSKMCQLPGSLLVQAVFIGGVVVSVRQDKIGGEARRIQ